MHYPAILELLKVTYSTQYQVSPAVYLERENHAITNRILRPILGMNFEDNILNVDVVSNDLSGHHCMDFECNFSI